MSLLAGFDFVAEISNQTLLDLVKANLKIQGKPANPPFELTIPITSSAANGSAHLIVTKLNLDLNPDDSITLTGAFANSSVSIVSPLSATLSSLDGTFTVNAPIGLVPAGTANQKSIGVDLASATTAVTFSTKSDAAIAQALGKTPLTPFLFSNLINQRMESFVQGIQPPAFPVQFAVVAGSDGSLTPKLQFAKLEVHCIEHPVRSQQALGVFGILLGANLAKGDHKLKTATSIAPGSGVAISISPQAFHQLVFCPGVAKALAPKAYQSNAKSAIAQLPTTCGKTSGMDKSGVTITKLGDSFAAGYIGITGAVSKSGFCYDASGTFTGKLKLGVAGSKIKPTFVLDQPDIDIDIPWYCWLVTAAVLGPIGVAIVAVVKDAAEGVAEDLSKSLLGGFALDPLSIAASLNASFTKVEIAKEGLTLNGTTSVALPKAASPSLSLQGAVMTVDKKAGKKGTFKGTKCPTGTFPYAESYHKQTAKYTAIATLLGRPTTLDWSISAGKLGPWGTAIEETKAIPLTGTAGTVVLPKVTTAYPFPLPDGTTVVQDVHVDYTVSAGNVQITNRGKEGKYAFWLYVKATDPAGTVRKAHLQAIFDGHRVEIGGGYAAKLAECLWQVNRRLKEKAEMAHMPDIDWIWPDHPAPGRLADLLDQLVRAGVPETEEILAHMRLVHGPQFDQALLTIGTAHDGSMASTAEPIVLDVREVEW